MADQTAVEQWLDALEGRKLADWDPERSVYRCDYCSETIHPLKHGRTNEDRRVSHYVSDKILEPGEGIVEFERGPFAFLRSYCPGCNRTRVRYPCQGFNELILSSHLRPEGSYTHFRIEHFSGADDGEPWDPATYYNAVADAIGLPGTFEDWLEMGKLGAAMKDAGTDTGNPALISHGPEDVVDHFEILGVEPRMVLDEDGDPTFPETTPSELQAIVDERAEELRHTIGDEKAFNREISSER